MSLFHVANNTGIALYPLVGGLRGLAFDWRVTFARHRRSWPWSPAAILLPLLRRMDFHGAGAPEARTDDSAGSSTGRRADGRALAPPTSASSRT